MSERRTCKCGTCGFQWPLGISGDHCCATELRRQRDEMRQRIAEVQGEGLKRARDLAYAELAAELLDGRNPTGKTIALVLRVAEAAYRLGVETEADALTDEWSRRDLAFSMDPDGGGEETPRQMDPVHG